MNIPEDLLVKYVNDMLSRIRAGDSINLNEGLDHDTYHTYVAIGGMTKQGAVFRATFNLEPTTLDRIANVRLVADGTFKFTCFQDDKNEPEFILDG